MVKYALTQYIFWNLQEEYPDVSNLSSKKLTRMLSKMKLRKKGPDKELWYRLFPKYFVSVPCKDVHQVIDKAISKWKGCEDVLNKDFELVIMNIKNRGYQIVKSNQSSK